MKIPEAAIEAAAEALRRAGTHYNSILHADTVARVVIDAAMPAIREAIAQEIEASLLPVDIPLSMRDWRLGVKGCARIVRGGTP